MKEDTLYKKIEDNDYLVRYKACKDILDKYKIPLGINEIRKVFPYILSNDIYNLKEKGINRLEIAQINLKKFIKEYFKETDYSDYSKDALDDTLLDECYVDYPQLEKLRELVSLGADINAKDHNGWTAFMYAIRHEDYEIMKFFLEQGADVNTRYPSSETSPEDYTTIWLNSIKYVPSEYINLMISHKANIREKDSEGNTVLHIYADGNPEAKILSFFIENSIDINAQNSDGDTALHILCRKQIPLDCVTCFLTHNARLDLPNNEGKTPLHSACWVYKTNKKITDLLLSAGADPNKKDTEGNTPLFIAVNRENKNLIKSLISAGADLHIKNNNGKTAYEIALEKGYLEIAKEISGNQAKKDYKEIPTYKELQRIKKQIINSLKEGKYKYYSNKEGYAKFLYKDGQFVYEWYEMGEEPPQITTYATPKQALQFMYNQSSYKYTGDLAEIDIYKDILDLLYDYRK